jgi:hypothetical protein
MTNSGNLFVNQRLIATVEQIIGICEELASIRRLFLFES